MKVAIEKSYPMPASPETVWVFLQNIESVAKCMPGAKITERIDDTHFKGTVSVKVGPASMAFKGNIEVRGLDEVQRSLRLVGKGSDSSGTSGASLDLTARVEPGATPDSSNLIGKSEVSMSGKAAAFGGRMMGTVADQILNQFAGNFAKQVSALAAQVATAAQVAAGARVAAAATDALAVSAPAGAQAPTAPAATAAVGFGGPGPSPTAAPVMPTGPAPTAAVASAGTGPTPADSAAPAMPISPTPANSAAATSLAASPAGQVPISAVTASGAPPSTVPDEPPNQINALALIWAIIRDWFRSLFRRKPA